jgi:DNA-directed RNA polymerase specialized sigma24 family protein
MEDPMANIARIGQITDPRERAIQIGKVLNTLPAIAAELRALRQAAVLELRARGLSYADISELLGLHRNRVQQIAEGRPGGGKGGVKRPVTRSDARATT